MHARLGIVPLLRQAKPDCARWLKLPGALGVGDLSALDIWRRKRFRKPSARHVTAANQFENRPAASSPLGQTGG
jgi:hypothetical protein